VAQNASPAQKDQALQSHSIGKLYKNENPSDARLYDLVCGEETTNADILDLSRVQNLFFTLIPVGAYAVSLASSVVVSAFPLNAFPELSESAVALLAISHAGYLVSKAGDKQ
jgi:hypothetical protein